MIKLKLLNLFGFKLILMSTTLTKHCSLSILVYKPTLRQYYIPITANNDQQNISVLKKTLAIQF